MLAFQVSRERFAETGSGADMMRTGWEGWNVRDVGHRRSILLQSVHPGCGSEMRIREVTKAQHTEPARGRRGLLQRRCFWAFETRRGQSGAAYGSCSRRAQFSSIKVQTAVSIFTAVASIV